MTDTAARPAHVPAELAREFALYFDAPLDDLFTPYDAFHEEPRTIWIDGLMGVSSSADSTGAWMLTRSDDIRAALQDASLFSSEAGTGSETPRMIPIFMDPPDHTDYRRLLTPLFAPAVVAKMEEGIRERARRLVEGVVDQGRCDFVNDLAVDFPTRVFTSWMGLPEEDTRQFVEMVTAMIHRSDPEAGVAAQMAAAAVLHELVTARMENPTDDLMSQIATQQVNGKDLTYEELMSIAFLLFLAGLDTVVAALSFSFAHLARTPSDRRALAERVADVDDAVEELLRRHTFVNLTRRVTRDVEFGGVQMKQGDVVLLSLTVAGRDPDQFPDPTTVELGRDANRHYAFGAGPHRCAGSHLARLEMRVFFEEWHARIPDYEIDGDIPAYSGTVMGITRLPLRWG